MKKMIIIGSGISSLASAYYLKDKFEITIIEKNNYLGGHTHTHSLEKENINYDSGFIVLNNKNYPNFINLLKEIGVEYQKSNMSFSVTQRDTNYEWAGKNIKTIFDLKNIFSFRYLRILKDIIKFSSICDKNLIYEKIKIVDFLKKNNFSKEFIDLYFFPMCSSIWSSDLNDIENYDTSFILNFFRNHGLHNIISKRPTWFTIKNGSKSYIEKILQKINCKVLLNEKVIEIDQINKKAKTINNKLIDYDILIMGSHSDQSYKILKDKTRYQEELLLSVKYQQNKVLIHTDEKVMPSKRKNWSSWNFKYNGKKLVLTYWMNLLQNLQCKTNVLVTLNSDEVGKDKIIKQIYYEHPLFTKSKEEVQKLSSKAQGINDVYFSGAWLGYGFHEDGVKSALEIKNLINAQ